MRKQILLCGAMFAAMLCQGNELSPEEALSRALTPSSSQRRAPVATAVSPSLKYTVKAMSRPAVYIFDRGGDSGYLVVSADDATTALLGYADHGTFDASQISPGLQYWLDQYASQVQYARTTPASAPRYVAQRTQRAAIAPLTTTRWNQSAPYNDDCPLDNGTRSVTGCVATALAQVMKYHNWPAKGTSSHSYTCNGSTLSVDYANTTYDWANMLDDYTSEASDVQKEAVANLMFSCGVAVDMQYTSVESSATSISVPSALVSYFNYDKGLRYIPRECYGLYDWEDIVYENLTKYGPVQYSGQSADGGHSFVCDGYSEDGYFHINWGWGGMSDGYFLLTALDPETQGIGGSTSGYNYQQDIIYGVTTPQADSQMYEQMYAQSAFVIEAEEAQTGGTIPVSLSAYNFSTGNISGKLGVKFTPVEGGDAVYGTGSSFTSLAPEAGFSSYYAQVPADLANGNYIVTPAFCTSTGEWRDIPVPLSCQQSMSAMVQDGVVYFSEPDTTSISVTDVTANTPFYIGSKYEVSATVANTGSSEYYGGLALGLIDSSNNLVALGSTYPVDLMSGDSTDIVYTSTFSAVNGATLSAGTYYICFIDPTTGRALSTLQEITLEAAPSETKIEATQPVVADADAVNSTSLRVTTTVTCSEGYFGGSLTLPIFPYSETSVSSVGALTSEVFFLNAGESKEITFTGAFTGATAGAKYMCAVYSGQTQLTGVSLFTVSTTSDAIDVEAAEEPCATEYYNIMGVRIADANPAPGHYIKIERYADGTARASHTIVK